MQHLKAFANSSLDFVSFFKPSFSLAPESCTFIPTG